MLLLGLIAFAAFCAFVLPYVVALIIGVYLLVTGKMEWSDDES